MAWSSGFIETIELSPAACRRIQNTLCQTVHTVRRWRGVRPDDRGARDRPPCAPPAVRPPAGLAGIRTAPCHTIPLQYFMAGTAQHRTAQYSVAWHEHSRTNALASRRASHPAVPAGGALLPFRRRSGLPPPAGGAGGGGQGALLTACRSGAGVMAHRRKEGGGRSSDTRVARQIRFRRPS